MRFQGLQLRCYLWSGSQSIYTLVSVRAVRVLVVARRWRARRCSCSAWAGAFGCWARPWVRRGFDARPAHRTRNIRRTRKYYQIQRQVVVDALTPRSYSTLLRRITHTLQLHQVVGAHRQTEAPGKKTERTWATHTHINTHLDAHRCCHLHYCYLLSLAIQPRHFPHRQQYHIVSYCKVHLILIHFIFDQQH